MAQFLRPDSNITQTSFTNGFAQIDEATASDADFAYGANNTAAVLEVGLSDPAATPDPAGTSTVRYRIARVNNGTLSGSGNNVTITAAVYQGATLIQADSAQNTSGTWTQFSFTFTHGSITDWTDLRLRFTTSASGGSPANRRGGAISWAEVEAPDAATVNITLTADGGSFAVTGNPSNDIRGYLEAGESGAFTVSGKNAYLLGPGDIVLGASKGTYLATGNAADTYTNAAIEVLVSPQYVATNSNTQMSPPTGAGTGWLLIAVVEDGMLDLLAIPGLDNSISWKQITRGKDYFYDGFSGQSTNNDGSNLSVYYKWFDGNDTLGLIGGQGAHSIGQIFAFNNVDPGTPIDNIVEKVLAPDFNGLPLPETLVDIGSVLPTATDKPYRTGAKMLYAASRGTDTNNTNLFSASPTADMPDLAKLSEVGTNASDGGGFAVFAGTITGDVPGDVVIDINAAGYWVIVMFSINPITSRKRLLTSKLNPVMTGQYRPFFQAYRFTVQDNYQTTKFKRSYRFRLDTGSYSLVGADAGLTPGRKIQGSAAAFSLQGIDANLSNLVQYKLVADRGLVALRERNAIVGSVSIATWQKTNVLYTTNIPLPDKVDPLGGLYTAKIYENTSTGVHETYQAYERSNRTYLAGQLWTASIYVKQFFGRNAALSFFTGSAANNPFNVTQEQLVSFDFATESATLNDSTSAVAWGAINAGNGWYRLYLTLQVPVGRIIGAGGAMSVGVLLLDGNSTSYTGQGSSYGVYTAFPEFSEGELKEPDITLSTGIVPEPQAKLFQRLLIAQPEALSVTFADSTLYRGITLTADVGIVSLSGNDAGIILPIYPTYPPSLDVVWQGQPFYVVEASNLGTQSLDFVYQGQPFAIYPRNNTVLGSPSSFSIAGGSAEFAFPKLLGVDAGAFNVTGQGAELKPSQGGLIAEPGSLSVAGVAAELRAALNLQAAPAEYTLTGSEVTLRAGRVTAAGAGAYSIDGTTAQLLWERALPADSGSYQLSGQSVGFNGQRYLSLELGSYSVNGISAELLRTASLSVESGSYTVNGQATGVATGRSLLAEAGSVQIQGQSVGFNSQRYLPIGAGEYEVAGQPVVFARQWVITAGSGVYQVSGQSVGFNSQRYLATEPGIFAVAGSTANLLASRALLVEAGSFSTDGQEAFLKATQNLLADSGSVLLTGQGAELITAHLLTVETGSFTVVGVAAETLRALTISAEPASIGAAFGEVNLSAGRTVTLEPGGYQVNGQSVGFNSQRYLSISQGSIEVTPGDAALLYSRLLLGDADSISINGTDITLASQRRASAETGEYSIVGEDAGLYRELKLLGSSTQYDWNGFASGLLASLRIAVDSSTYEFTGNDATILAGRQILSDVGSYLIIGQSVGFNQQRYIVLTSGDYFVNGINVGLSYGKRFDVNPIETTVVGVNSLVSYRRRAIIST